jgi:hypothetical protein
VIWKFSNEGGSNVVSIEINALKNLNDALALSVFIAAMALCSGAAHSRPPCASTVVHAAGLAEATDAKARQSAIDAWKRAVTRRFGETYALWDLAQAPGLWRPDGSREARYVAVARPCPAGGVRSIPRKESGFDSYRGTP